MRPRILAAILALPLLFLYAAAPAQDFHNISDFLIAQALMQLLPTLPSAWAESSPSRTHILRVESKELALVWSKETTHPAAWVQCAAPKNSGELSYECALLNSLQIALVGPNLQKAKK